MKTVNWFVFSMLVLGLCTAQVNAVQCTAGIGISIIGEFQGTDTEAATVHIGDTIDYDVVVSLTAETCPITNGVVQITLPDGTVIQLDNDLSLSPGNSQSYSAVGTYVVAAADQGEYDNPGVPGSPDADEVRAEAQIIAVSNTGTGPQDVFALANWDSRVIVPCIDVNKVVDPTVSTVGGDVTYTITICNCGDANLTLTAVDDNVGGVITNWLPYVPAAGLVLSIGECTTFQVPYTIPQGAQDPLCDTVCATGVDPIGGPAGTVTDCDPACVDLVQPAINIEKSCPEFALVGDVITYEVCITNTGGTSLEILSVEDDVADANQTCVGDILAPAASCCFSYPYTVQPGDPDPLINTVSVIGKVVGVDVNVTDSTTCETDILHPDFDVNKECLTEPVEGDMAQFRITIENTGDVNLIINTNEPEIPADQLLAVGQTIVVDVNRAVVPGESEVSNTIEVTATLPAVYELPTEIVKSASASCTVPGAEGCTPGFWKNSTACWCEDFNTTDKLGSVFTIPCGAVYGTGSNCLANKTMLQALSFQGGSTTKAKAQILLRAAVAALLNACNNNVDFPLTEEAIIDAVNDAIASMNKTEIITLAGALDYYNNFGCPISSANSSNPCSPNDD